MSDEWNAGAGFIQGRKDPEIEMLDKRIAELEKLLADCDPQWQHAVSENMRLQAENKRLQTNCARSQIDESISDQWEKDAERYRKWRWMTYQGKNLKVELPRAADQIETFEAIDRALDAVEGE